MKDNKLSNRIIEIDIIRAIAILFMIFDHIMYDCGFIMSEIFPDFGLVGWSNGLSSFARYYWYMDLRIYFREVILFIFMALTGICCSFSKNNILRGIKLGIISIIITIATFIVGLVIKDNDITITFGVLHCISLSLLLAGLLEFFLKNKKWNKYLYLGIGVLFIVIGTIFYLQNEYVSYEGNNFFILFLEMLIGTKGAGSDYFPFLLYCGEIFVGIFLGKLIYQNKKSIFNINYHNNPLTFIGRNSLYIYVFHQILIPVILFVICLICGFKMAL